MTNASRDYKLGLSGALERGTGYGRTWRCDWPAGRGGLSLSLSPIARHGYELVVSNKGTGVCVCVCVADDVRS